MGFSWFNIVSKKDQLPHKMDASLGEKPNKNLTLGHTRKVIPPPWYKRGLMEPLPRVFDMLQYFETILPSVESL